jgi:hypothetical protein
MYKYHKNENNPYELVIWDSMGERTLRTYPNLDALMRTVNYCWFEQRKLHTIERDSYYYARCDWYRYDEYGNKEQYDEAIRDCSGKIIPHEQIIGWKREQDYEWYVEWKERNLRWATRRRYRGRGKYNHKNGMKREYALLQDADHKKYCRSKRKDTLDWRFDWDHEYGRYTFSNKNWKQYRKTQYK